LDYELDKKFGDFIVKMRDLYYKKKQINPLKAKRRFVVGMREIEKYIRLDEVKCLFVTPNIEKVEGEHSLDDRLYKIFKDCEIKKIPKIFGMNKFKLGKLARKKYSCVSMLAFVNVEGFEREFRDLLEYAEKFRNKFYENFRNIKDSFKDNIFINMELFDIQEKPNNSN
jgi:selenocysteine insertion sequence-binding protein 2